MKYILITLCLVFLVFTGYLFYFAPCQTVKDFWFMVQTPGRCITIKMEDDKIILETKLGSTRNLVNCSRISEDSATTTCEFNLDTKE